MRPTGCLLSRSLQLLNRFTDINNNIWGTSDDVSASQLLIFIILIYIYIYIYI